MTKASEESDTKSAYLNPFINRSCRWIAQRETSPFWTSVFARDSHRAMPQLHPSFHPTKTLLKNCRAGGLFPLSYAGRDKLCSRCLVITVCSGFQLPFSRLCCRLSCIVMPLLLEMIHFKSLLPSLAPSSLLCSLSDQEIVMGWELLLLETTLSGSTSLLFTHLPHSAVSYI